MIFEKCEKLGDDKEKQILYAKDVSITISKLTKNSIEEKFIIRFNCSLLFLEIIAREQGDFIFIIFMNME